jgi:hypothetical protein
MAFIDFIPLIIVLVFVIVVLLRSRGIAIYKDTWYNRLYYRLLGYDVRRIE